MGARRLPLGLLALLSLPPSSRPAAAGSCDAELGAEPGADALASAAACHREAAEAALLAAEGALRRARAVAPDGGAAALVQLGRSPQLAASGGAVEPAWPWAPGWTAAHSTALRAQFFARGATDLLTASLLADLRMLSDAERLAARSGDVGSFVADLLYWFSVPAYAPPTAELGAFFPYHPLISNLVALTPLRTTDAAVASLVRGCNMSALASGAAAAGDDRGCAGLEKAMVLYSARNTLRLNAAALFRHSPGFASLWYSAYFWLGYGALSNPVAFANMKQHMGPSSMPPRLLMEATSNFGLDCLLNVYYMCTYVDPLREKHVRQLVNSWANGPQGVAGLIRQSAGVAEASRVLSREHRDAAPRILVIDAFWVHTYSSHRVVFRLIDQLQQAFEVDLLRASTNAVSMLEGFKAVYEMPRRSEDDSVLFRETIDWVVSQGYAAVLYPSISMDRVTLWLSQFRLAPIQVASYGQPVSTHGSQIDYWLAGEAVGPEHFKDFSERLLLLPDMGILHTYPSHYEWDGDNSPSVTDVPAEWFCAAPRADGSPKPEGGEAGERLIINTQAAVHKTNAEWVAMLVRIVTQAAPRPVTVRDNLQHDIHSVVLSALGAGGTD